MIKNDLLTAVRQFRKSPLYSALNILGLAVGIACSILIFLWVRNELGYDRFLPGAERIYRVTADVSLRSGQKKQYALTAAAMAKALKDDYPEVEASTRILPQGQILLRSGEKAFFEERLTLVDPGFLDVFSLPLRAGNPSEALRQPHSILLTQEAARKYFGDENPLGKTLTADNATDYQVTGVLGDLPANFHIPADFLACPGDVLPFNQPLWTALAIYTYVRLGKDASASSFEAKIQDLAEKYVRPHGRQLFRYRLQSLTSIHLRSDREGEFAPVVGIMQVLLLSAVAILVLVVACINFINLSTARAGRRAREVGLRKVLGAHRRRLFVQFLSESSLSSAAAFVLGLGLAGACLPWFNSFWGTTLLLDIGPNLPVLAGLVVAMALFSGSYPAVVLSSFQPSSVLRGQRSRGRSGLLLRRGLIVFQFAASIVLFISTAVVSGQMRFLRTKSLGFDKDRVLAVRLRSADLIRDYEGTKRAFLANPDIVRAAASSVIPGLFAWTVPYVPEGFEDNAILIRTLYVDHDFIPALGLKMAEGRSFSPDWPTDSTTAYIINRTAQARFGWKEALGKTITCTNRNEPEKTATGRVVGVVEDFHVRSLHQTIEPTIIRVRPESFQFLLLKLRTENPDTTVRFIEDKIKTLQPEFPPEIRFLDEAFQNLYMNERRLGRIFTFFSAITVLVACLGLFGLAAYLAEQRTREIGIRKVLGATKGSVVWLLTGEFARWVLLSNLVAWPAAYWVMERWLRSFPYGAGIHPAVMVLSGLAALAIALVTVGVQASRAAAADPVRSLRHE